MDTPVLSVLVAAFNEEASIEACLLAIAETYPRDVEILVIDGGHDATGDIVRALQPQIPGLRYVRNAPDLGKGHAIRHGIAEARADVMAQLDADLQFLPSDLPRLVAPILDGRADVVLGSRFLSDSTRLRGGTPLHRSLGNRAISAYASLLFGHPMSDVLAGIKAWSRKAIERIDLRSDGYSYEAEIATRALQHGLRVLDVPVTTRARMEGRSNVDVLRVGGRLLLDISRFRVRTP